MSKIWGLNPNYNNWVRTDHVFVGCHSNFSWMQVKVVPVPRQVLPFYTSAEIFSHCIISAALQCTSKLDALALPPTQTRPGQDFTISRPRCVEKVKSAPLENLGEIRVAGEEWRYPQQFCLNTNWTLLRAEHFTAHRLRDSRGEVEGHHNHHDGFEVRCIELMRLIMTRVIWRNCNCHVALDHIIIQL